MTYVMTKEQREKQDKINKTIPKLPIDGVQFNVHSEPDEKGRQSFTVFYHNNAWDQAEYPIKGQEFFTDLKDHKKKWEERGFKVKIK